MSTAAWEGRREAHVFSTCLCLWAHSRQPSGSCSGVMFLFLRLLLLLLLLGATYSASCVSGLTAILSPLCPVPQSVDQVTVLFVRSSSIPLSSDVHHQHPHHFCSPQTDRRTRSRTRTDAQTAARANVLWLCREMVVIVVTQEPVELESSNIRL